MAIIIWFSRVITKVHRVILTKTRIGFALLFCLLASLAVFANTFEFWSSSQSIVRKSEITMSKQGERIYQNEPFTGKMVSYYDSGAVASEDEFFMGRRQGYAKKWFTTGVLAYESQYLSGARDGFTRTWWVNGNPRSDFFYIMGKTQGIGWRWYRSGAKFKKFNNHQGQAVGIQQAWRENGKLFSNFEYKNGRIYGLRKANNCVGLEDEVISVDYFNTQANNTL